MRGRIFDFFRLLEPNIQTPMSCTPAGHWRPTGDSKIADMARACGKREILYCSCIGCLCCYIMAHGQAEVDM